MVAGHWLLASQHHARLRGVLANVIGQLLIHADTVVNDGSSLNGYSGKQIAGHSRMDSLAGGRLVEQTVDDVDFTLHR